LLIGCDAQPASSVAQKLQVEKGPPPLIAHVRGGRLRVPKGVGPEIEAQQVEGGGRQVAPSNVDQIGHRR